MFRLGLFRMLKIAALYVVFVSTGVFLLVLSIYVELKREAGYRRHYGANWQAEFEKYHGSLAQAHLKIAIAVGALLSVITILCWYYQKNVAAKSRHSGRSSSRRRTARQR